MSTEKKIHIINYRDRNNNIRGNIFHNKEQAVNFFNKLPTNKIISLDDAIVDYNEEEEKCMETD